MRDHRMVHIPVIDNLSTFLADAIKHCYQVVVIYLASTEYFSVHGLMTGLQGS